MDFCPVISEMSMVFCISVFDLINASDSAVVMRTGVFTSPKTPVLIQSRVCTAVVMRNAILSCPKRRFLSKLSINVIRTGKTGKKCDSLRIYPKIFCANLVTVRGNHRFNRIFG